MITWNSLIDPSSDILGYSLEIYNTSSAQFVEIFNGKYSVNTLEYLVTGLTTGTSYEYRMRALNENGYGDYSPVVSYYSCVSPSSFSKPIALS